MLVLSSLQPFYIPWLGVFNLIENSDIFCFADNLQYTRRDWISRNRIQEVHKHVMWLTVPVKRTPLKTTKISSAEICYLHDWISKHLKAIEFNYSRAEYFKEIFKSLEAIITKRHKYIIDLNTELMFYFLKILKINTKIKFESEFILPKEKNAAIIDLCLKNKAQKYYTGKRAQNYIREDMFEQAGIKIEYQNYIHPLYPQFIKPFKSHLSIIDSLLMAGPEKTKNFINQNIKG